MIRSFLLIVLDFFLPSAQETRIARSIDEVAVRALISPRSIVTEDGTVLGLLPYKESVVKALLWALKYRSSPHAAALFASVLRESLMEEWVDAELQVCPIRMAVVPRSAEGIERFGSNHLERVVAGLPPPMRATLLPQTLTRDRRSVRQTKLGRRERLLNMRGAFSIGPDNNLIRDAHIIVIDDVVTTGATLMEARRALLEAGAKEVSLIALTYS